MKIHDISVPIFPGMHVYPGDPDVSVERTLRMDRGDVANVTHLNFGTHTGTHIDAPHHFVDGAMIGVRGVALQAQQSLGAQLGER